MDPRIHFALVCGAKSCPPIRLYSAANLEEGLAAAAEAFVGGEVEVDVGKREVRLSKIFKVSACVCFLGASLSSVLADLHRWACAWAVALCVAAWGVLAAV